MHTVNIRLYTDVVANLKLEVKDEKELNAEETEQTAEQETEEENK